MITLGTKHRCTQSKQFSVNVVHVWYYKNVGMVLQQNTLLTKENKMNERIGQLIVLAYSGAMGGLATCMAIAQVIA